MTTTSREAVISKLQFLQEAIGKLKKYQRFSAAEFNQDERNEYTVERLFQTSLEAVIDIARYFIIEHQLQKPGENRGEFEILGQAGLLPQELSGRLGTARGFRNILVHEYVAIERAQVYRNLQEDLKDLEEFSQVVARLFQEKPVKQ
jgi:uncharacterized protein YutE (UPF0331/DUF86 family)